MTPGAVVEALRAYATWTESAISTAGSMEMRAQLRKHHKIISDGVELLEQLRTENDTLRERLLRQACWFEQFEARQTPPSYPLLEDDGFDDYDDPGVAL